MSAPDSLVSIARLVATGLADSILVGSAIAFLGCILVVLLRRRSAAARFGVLMAAMVATAFLPLLRIAGARAVGESGSLLRVPDSWAIWVLGAWGLIAGLALLRIVLGILNLRKMRRACRRLPASPLSSELFPLLTQYCPSREVQILISEETRVPAAIGFFAPAVVLPAWVIAEMSAEEVRHVVIHELAHLERRDDWTNLVQQLVRALFFFHPAVWWIENRLSLERELACDDKVLSRAKDPRDYAECLTRIAEKSLLRRGVAMAQAAVGRVRQTSHRVARILRRPSPLDVRRNKLTVAVATIIAVTFVAGLWRVPRLVSFDDAALADSAHVMPPALSPPALSAMAGEVAVVRPLNAAWHVPIAPKTRKVRKAQPKTLSPAPEMPVMPEARLLRASWSADDPALSHRMVIVVVQEYDGVTFWQITTWYLVPSQPVRLEHKTT